MMFIKQSSQYLYSTLNNTHHMINVQVTFPDNAGPNLSVYVPTHQLLTH